MVVPVQQPLIQQDRGFLVMLRAAHASPGFYPQGSEHVAFGSTWISGQEEVLVLMTRTKGGRLWSEGRKWT